MKKSFLTFAGLLLFVCTSYAQIDTVSTAQVDQYIGKEVVLKGTLKGFKNYTDKNGQEIMFLDIDDRFPHTKVGVTIFNSAFADVSIDSTNIDKPITVWGFVKLYKNKPSIGVNDPRAVVTE